MTLFRYPAVALAALVAADAAPAAPPPALPAAIYADPPYDAAHPASTLAIGIPSHGALLNGVVYRPAGVGPFPLVVFIHGLPGNEQNLDLAQAMRRAGWAVLTFHYRGAFGSEGQFSIDNTLEDADAVMAYVRQPATAQAWNVDRARVVVMGHSLGGLAAAYAAKRAPERLATVLIAPWDPSTLASLFRPMTLPERNAAALDRWSDFSHGRISGATVEGLAADIVDHGERWRLADTAPPLATRPTLLVTATRDLASSRAAGLKADLVARRAPLDLVDLETGHTFDDRRIALETAVVTWLARLPGAPRAP